MHKLYFTSGANLYDFFIIPTIRINRTCNTDGYLTIEWLKWFIGIKW